MSPPPLVLDTNVYSFAKVEVLARLAARGLLLRASDIALHEAWARSVREYQNDGVPLKRARGKLFARARSVAPYLDKQTPIAAGGGVLTRRIIARVDGTAHDSEGAHYLRHLREVWRTLIGPGMTDSQWIENGMVAEKHLNELDKNLFELARREEELRKNPVPNDVDPDTLPGLYKQWDSMTDDQRLALLGQYARQIWKLSDAAAERLDGHIRVTALRLHCAASGARMPKENDGADVALTIHLGDGCILVTNENPLINLVDQSETFQRPWVRQLNDLDELPDGPPWGEPARQTAAVFRRRASTG